MMNQPLKEFSTSHLEFLIAQSTALGKNVMNYELGFFGPYDGVLYDLDRQTQNVLLAHGRQDAANTQGLATDALRQAYKSRRLGVWTVILLMIVVILQLIILTAIT